MNGSLASAWKCTPSLLPNLSQPETSTSSAMESRQHGPGCEAFSLFRTMPGHWIRRNAAMPKSNSKNSLRRPESALKLCRAAAIVWGMFEDRDYLRQSRVRPEWSATIAILAANVIIYAFQCLAGRFAPAFPFEPLFALSLGGLQHGFIWQLLTFQFMHGNLLHIVLNLWAVFVFGRAVEVTLGRRRMLQLYLLSGVVGGLVQVLFALLLPEYFGGLVVGASAGAFGLVAAFAMLFPNQRLFMLLFFIIPLAMRARTLLWLSLVFAVFGIILPLIQPWLSPWFAALGIPFKVGNVAHAAHLGGILTGLVFARSLLRRRRTPSIIDLGGESSLNINRAPD
jgi:membrane associated rhomboid family serine protease